MQDCHKNQWSKYEIKTYTIINLGYQKLIQLENNIILQ